MTSGSTALASIFLNHHMRLDLTTATPTDSSFKGRPDLSAPSSRVDGQKPQDTGVPGPLHSHRSPMPRPLPCQDCGPSESSRTLLLNIPSQLVTKYSCHIKNHTAIPSIPLANCWPKIGVLGSPTCLQTGRRGWSPTPQYPKYKSNCEEATI